MDALRSAPRILEQGCSGPDVALLQRDLNVWYRLWGAPAPVLLHEDGVLGELTELAFRRASRRLGLVRVVVGEKVQITPRDRLIVRHLGRLLLAHSEDRAYAVPSSVKRTPEEIERGKEARDYERRLKARFAAERAELDAADPRPEISASVCNQSSRRGLKPRIIVLHTTEGHNRPGLTDLSGLVRFFDNPASQASSHVANDAEGNDARMVPDESKAWTQAAFNAVALSIEQIGFASQTTLARRATAQHRELDRSLVEALGHPAGALDHARHLPARRSRRGRRRSPRLRQRLSVRPSDRARARHARRRSMTRPNADTGDLPAYTIGLGYDEAALAAAEAVEERAGRAVAAADRRRPPKAAR